MSPYLLDFYVMQVKKTTSSDTKTTFSVLANETELEDLKAHVLTHFRSRVKVPGFRQGNVPVAILEKHVDPNALQTEFLEEAVEQMYVQGVNELKLRPVDQPKITIKKFVPFTQLEFDAEVDTIGEIKLPDYKKLKKTPPSVVVTDKDVDEVVNSLRTRLAEKKDVNRPAKSGDQIWIDFEGTNSKGEPVKGADGKDYPLMLGSNTFIPGFEDNLIGAEAGQEKTFTLTFPKDYGIKAIAGQKVTFKVSIIKVQEVIEPEVDDEFAAKAGPFTTLKELKEDIRKQLSHERSHELRTEFESQLIREITSKSSLDAPEPLVNQQAESMLQEIQQNLVYRGQTFPEFLEAEGKTEEQFRKDLIPQAEERVKASLVLSEIAEKENVEVTPEELEIRIQLLKGQYKDAAMQTELNKPEARRDIASRLLTEKTIQKLVEYVT
jgi:trigger factor